MTKIPKNEVMKMKRIQHQTTGNSNLILIQIYQHFFYKFHDYKWPVIHIVYNIRQRFLISYFWTVFTVKLETLVNFVHLCLPAVHEEYTYTRSDLYVTYWGNCYLFSLKCYRCVRVCYQQSSKYTLYAQNKLTSDKNKRLA